ncbi:tetratricopeptide repeat protein [Synechococcus sp. MIT S1220]|uniref:O-linked N-acetylglucosamine transferase, SPINDLY family protein n=1 Tax=Synechococcus sp. MIT S1220 TaxID=3082549 RepID=UPI0039B027B5
MGRPLMRLDDSHHRSERGINVRADEQMNLALRAHASGDLESAVAGYRQVLQISNDIQAAVNLGAALRSLNRLPEAVDHYRFWQQHGTNNVQFVLNGANALLAIQEWEEAIAWVDPLVRGQPNLVAVKIKCKALINRGNADAAAVLLQQVLELDPKDHDAAYDLTLADLKRGAWQKALDRIDHFLEHTPNHQEFQVLSVRTRRQLGDLNGARERLSRLKAIQTNAVVIYRLEAEQCSAEGQTAVASQLWESLCQHDPSDAQHWLGWAASVFGQKQPTRASRILKQGMLWHPQNKGIERALLQALINRGYWSEATQRQWKRTHEGLKHWAQDQLFSFQFLGSGFGLADDEALKSAAKTWEKQQTDLIQTPLWPDRIAQPLTGRRLRLGYLSADWRQHPVAQFILPVLQQHQRKHVEVFGLNATPHADAITSQIERSCEHWLNLPRHHRHGAARMIADLQLDVLVELGGFTEGSALDLLLYRPAPIQLSYLGYFSSTHLNAVDGWIGDKTLFNSERNDQNKHIILKGGSFSIDLAQLPHLKEIANGAKRRYRFGCFNHSRKLTHQTLQLFARCLARSPAAELWLKSPTFRDPLERAAIQRRAQKAGINSDQLVLMDWMHSREDHLHAYQQIDVALDPAPYGGATTSVEALAMGTPVVTLKGAGMVGCLTSSLLEHGDCSAWIAENADEYVRIAVGLSKQGVRTKGMRTQLRNLIKSSPLGNPRRLASDLEDAYVTQWQRIKPL